MLYIMREHAELLARATAYHFCISSSRATTYATRALFLPHISRCIFSCLVVRERVWVLRLQSLGLHEIELLLRIVALTSFLAFSHRALRCCLRQVAILLVVPLLERLHKLRLCLLHEVLNLHHVHLQNTMLLEGLPVTLLEILQVLDEGILLFIYELLLSCSLRIAVCLFPCEPLLSIIYVSLLTVRSGQSVLDLCSLLTKLLSVLFKCLLIHRTLFAFPLGENRLFVGRLLVVSRRLHRARITPSEICRVTLFPEANGASVLRHWAGIRRSHADTNAFSLLIQTNFTLSCFW
mmetsp:Transcript_134812/g.234356  ORF Transcript_134812/g.234356 Transcript_134812/m.234356 type:complete len:293 (+) Transcript_134812:55-933(+)